jgi:iron complex outermembrane recepter protein
MIKLLFILISLTIYAQDSVYTLSPVEVTDVRRGLNDYQSYILIESEEIQRGETGLTLEQAFSIVPGVTVTSRNNPSMGDKISIRGIGSRASFGVRGIKLLLDNIPLTMPDGQSQINNIDILSTGIINVLKGPASSFYGNASGGVIKIFTEIPSQNPINISPAFLAGEDGLYKYSLKLSGTVDDHAYLISFNNTNYEGYRDHSAQKSYHVNSIYKTTLTDNIFISAVVNLFSSPYMLNPGTLDKTTAEENPRFSREFVKAQGAGQKTDQFQGGINLSFNSNDFDFESTIYYVRRNLLNPIPGRIIDLGRDAGGFRSAVSKEITASDVKIDFTAGIDIEHQSDNRNEFVNEGVSIELRPAEIYKNLNYGSRLLNQNESITGAGPFAAAEFMYKNKIGLISVIRYDYFDYKVTDRMSDNSGSRTMEQVSPSGGIMFRPDIYSRIFFNYSTSFQTPTAGELSNRPDGQGGFNPDLNPERIRHLELGGEYLISSINGSISASVYRMNFEGLLIPFQSTVSEEIFYRNAGKAVNNGFELTAALMLIKDFAAAASFNYMDFKFDDYVVSNNNADWQLKGNKVPGIPLQTISFSLNYLPLSGLWSKLNIQWNDSYYTNDFNGPPPSSNSPEENFINDSYLQIDFRGGYLLEFERLRSDIYFGINNLLNVNYSGSVVPNAAAERFFEPAPGRTFYFGIRFLF